MNERVLEIVFYIFDSMNATNEENILNELHTLSEKLIEKGFTENEIDSALSWVVENIAEIEEEDQLGLHNQFTLNNSEHWVGRNSSNSDFDSHNSIVHLSELDVIGDLEIEQILDHSLKKGKHGTSVSEIKAMVNNLMLTPENPYYGSFFVFNSSRYTL